MHCLRRFGICCKTASFDLEVRRIFPGGELPGASCCSAYYSVGGGFVAGTSKADISEHPEILPSLQRGNDRNIAPLPSHLDRR